MIDYYYWSLGLRPRPRILPLHADTTQHTALVQTDGVPIKDWILKKQTKVYSRFLVEKISEFIFILLSAFTLIMRIMTSPKNFEKLAILEI